VYDVLGILAMTYPTPAPPPQHEYDDENMKIDDMTRLNLPRALINVRFFYIFFMEVFTWLELRLKIVELLMPLS